MLMVTYEAKELIAESDRRSTELPLRLVVGPDESIELRPSPPDTSDLTFSHLGNPLLVIEADLAGRLDSKELTVAETDDGPQLTLRDRSSRVPPSIH